MKLTSKKFYTGYCVLFYSIIILSTITLSNTQEVSAQTPTITLVKTLAFSDVSDYFDEWKTDTGSSNVDDKILAVLTNDGTSSYITSIVNNDIQGFVSETTIDNAVSINYIQVISIADKTNPAPKATKFSQGLAMDGIPIALPSGGVALQPGFVQFNQTFYSNPFTENNPNNQQPWNLTDLLNLEYIVEQNTDTKEVRVTQFFAEVSYEIYPPTITITDHPSTIPWGNTATISGIVTNANDGDIITIDWGDGSTPDEIIIDGSSSWNATHEYSTDAIGPNTVTATLTVETFSTFDTVEIIVEKHDTTIVDFVTASGFLTAGSPFSVMGTLIDLDNQNLGIENKNITFSGDGSSGLSVATTGGATIDSDTNNPATSLEVVPCGYCSIGSGPNVVLLEAEDKIKFDVPVTWATLYFEDNSAKTLNSQALGLPEIDVFNDGTLNSGFYVVYGPGVSEITINSIIGDGSNIGLIRITASNQEGNVLIIDEDVTNIPEQSVESIDIGGGSFSSMGDSPSIVGRFDITALFSGDNLYISSNTVDSFNLEANQNGDTQTGTGNLINVVADAGTGYTGILCGSDADSDAICTLWENQGPAFGVDGKTYFIDLPNRNDSIDNVYVEIDYMNYHQPNPTAIQDVITAFAQNGISLTVFVDEQLTHVDTINIWTDNDSDATNDFDSIKSHHFGFASERSTATNQNVAITSGVGTASQTLEISGIQVTTPPHSSRIIPHPTAAGPDLTQGTITIKTKIITTGSPVTLTVPATIPIPPAGAGLNIFVPPKVSVLPIPGNEHIVTVQAKFKTTGAITNVSLGPLTVPLTFTSATTATPETYPNSPFASSTLTQAYAQVVRYVIFGHSSGGPSGTAEYLGNDAAITLGEGFGGSVSGHSGSVGTTDEQSGTFMHELGHWLGLKHGGPEKIGTTIVTDADINCKPNYASAMSYSRQTPAYLGANWVLDYSHGYMESLTENDLDERRGFFSSSANPSRHVFAFPDLQVRTPPSWTTGQSSIGANFNGANGFELNHVFADINNFGIPGCNASEISTTAYHDYDEWSNLKFNFRDTVSGQYDGGNPNHPTPNGDLNSDNYQDQILQGFQFNGALPPPSTDGLEIRQKGSSLPLKIPILDSMGNSIDYAQIYAKYTVGTNTNEKNVKDSKNNIIFTYSEREFYSLNWNTPKKAGTYYITAYLVNPTTSGEDWPIINEELEPQIINPAGDLVTFKVTLK